MVFHFFDVRPDVAVGLDGGLFLILIVRIVQDVLDEYSADRVTYRRYYRLIAELIRLNLQGWRRCSLSLRPETIHDKARGYGSRPGR